MHLNIVQLLENKFSKYEPDYVLYRQPKIKDRKSKVIEYGAYVARTYTYLYANVLVSICMYMHST